MAVNFFQQQLDYVYFLYGLSFLFLAGACAFLIFSNDRKLSWLWLGLFALIHGINEWLDLCALSLGDSPLLKYIRLAFLIISFLFLAEFGRSSLFSIFKSPRRWIFVPFAIAAASEWMLYISAGLDITVRYSLGFAGGLFTAFCIWRISVKAGGSNTLFLKMLSIILGLYAFTQIVVPKTVFFPASVINQDAFMDFLGLPVQIIRYLLAVSMSALVWKYWMGIPLTLDNMGLLKIKKITVPAWILAAICVILSLAGWGVVYKVGVKHDRQEQKYTFETVSSIAAAMDSEHIKNLSGSSDDLTNPDYSMIRERISLVHKALPGYRSVYLIGSRARKTFFFVNSDAIYADTDASFPGKIFEEAPKELNEIFSTGKTLINKPLIDKFGAWLSYYVPIKDLATGEVLAVMGVDIDQIRWRSFIFKERFEAILFAGVLWIFFIGGFVVFQISSLARQRIAFSEENLFLTVHYIADGVIATNITGQIIRMNPVAERLTGWPFSEASGRDFSEVFCPIDMKTRHPEESIAAQAAERNKIVGLAKDAIIIARNGAKSMVAGNAAPIRGEGGVIIGVVVVFRDITEYKKTEEKLSQAFKEAVKSHEILAGMLDDNHQIRQRLEHSITELKRSQNMLIQSEKLVSLGRLVSEIAHEVNNPLMIISGNAQLSLMSGPLSAEVKNSLQIIMDECQKAKSTILRLLKFSKPSKGEIKEVDINRSLEALMSILEPEFKLANIEIRREYGDKLAVIPIDEQMMQELFTNLINNAKDAMPEGGVVTIKTFTEGDYLRIDFKDTGSGMSEEVKKKLFEPFFTTKERGTGLGLSICYGIIKAHNGELKFESEFNKGCTATVLLPLRKKGGGDE